MPEGERQDYVWEHLPLFREAHIGELKNTLNPFYELNHLYLVLDDSIGILRDLAQEQDEVVGWLNQWRERNNNEMRYITASYIDTLMSVGENTARQTSPDSKLLKNTTPEQRTRIYDYLNARNDWHREHHQGPVPATTSAGQYSAMRGGAHAERPQTRFARLDVENKHSQMVLILGKPLHEELKDDIEALEENSQGTLNGVGLGSRGIYDLVRHQEMQAYLTQERSHLQRWTQRLDDITHDRVRLFTQGELFRSAWYFDPDHPDQLKSALAMELNCTRDLCRTDESLRRVSDYFHDNPHYILPVFYGRLDMDFLRAKSGSLLKWLDDIHNFSDGLADAQRRVADISHIMGNHWTNSLNLAPAALPFHQAVNASYIPAVALHLERWLIEMQKQLNSPQLRQHLDNFSKASNRAQRLGITDPQLHALNAEIDRLRAGAFGGYATQGAAAAALKGSFFPLLAVYLQVGNLGEAWSVWKASKGNRSVKENFIWASTLSSVASASISVFQAVYLAMTSEAFKAITENSSETRGMLFGVRMGQWGMGLGAIIAPLSLVGAAGTTWNNVEKWKSGLISGNSGEKSGAFTAMSGDIGGTGISAVLTGHAGKELIGFLKDIYPETGDAREPLQK
ncbi:hypothetical protein B7R56_27490, partial [Pseudomonas savastanoi pv. retacarpa]